jgi:hypothetical protein
MVSGPSGEGLEENSKFTAGALEQELHAKLKTNHGSPHWQPELDLCPVD